ncbi:hypothetical protein pkur_cds_667 [Pandoravirus kuranda]|uniref:Ankyrin repeat domain containing protein n=1 Tax=Pandoravirus kuranda TaxID=3019033 RepID=A0AA95ED58_9VIRU|nr:hypothetical protein pkur_cds_667 [Pandoravirus kuranda]
MRPEYRHLPAAAMGGHVAVLGWLCERLKPIPAYKTDHIKQAIRCTPGPDPQRPRCIAQRIPERSDPEAPIARKTASGKAHYAEWARSFSTSSDSSTEEEDVAVPDRGSEIIYYDDSHSDHSRPSEGEVTLTGAQAETDRDGDDGVPWDHLVCVATEAACLGHVDALRYLTTACPLVDEPQTLLDSNIVAEAARQGALGTVAYMHDRRTRPRPSGGGGRVVVRNGASPCNVTNLARAIKGGDDRLVDAISTILASGKHDPDGEAQAACRVPLSYANHVMERALASAARRGHLRALAIAHARGFAPITATMLGLAASSGRLDVLRWAAGETVPGIETHLAPTEPLPWDAQEVVWMAARPSDPNVDVLQWLADRPETRVHFDTLMARTLIAYGRHRATLWMHDAGLVSLASWDSLETAVGARSRPDVLAKIIDRGVACSPLAMAMALNDSMDGCVVALLCERYGHADLAEAVHLYGCGLRGPAIQWVHYNVPEVPVEHIIKAGTDRGRRSGSRYSGAASRGVDLAYVICVEAPLGGKSLARIASRVDCGLSGRGFMELVQRCGLSSHGDYTLAE